MLHSSCPMKMNRLSRLLELNSRVRLMSLGWEGMDGLLNTSLSDSSRSIFDLILNRITELSKGRWYPAKLGTCVKPRVNHIKDPIPLESLRSILESQIPIGTSKKKILTWKKRISSTLTAYESYVNRVCGSHSPAIAAGAKLLEAS